MSITIIVCAVLILLVENTLIGTYNSISVGELIQFTPQKTQQKAFLELR